jgi:hypothetical protein
MLTTKQDEEIWEAKTDRDFVVLALGMNFTPTDQLSFVRKESGMKIVCEVMKIIDRIKNKHQIELLEARIDGMEKAAKVMFRNRDYGNCWRGSNEGISRDVTKLKSQLSELKK